MLYIAAFCFCRSCPAHCNNLTHSLFRSLLSSRNPLSSNVDALDLATESQSSYPEDMSMSTEQMPALFLEQEALQQLRGEDIWSSDLEWLN